MSRDGEAATAAGPGDGAGVGREPRARYVRLLCLANSRKVGGCCLAGKEVRRGGFGRWVRPVTTLPQGEIPASLVPPGVGPRSLIEVPLLGARAHPVQPENWLLDTDRPIRILGPVVPGALERAVDEIGGPLWVNGHSSGKGLNDHVPVEEAAACGFSLALIRPDRAAFRVRPPFSPQDPPQVRVRFGHGGEEYDLAVTDPVWEQRVIHSVGAGSARVLIRPHLCLSLGEEFHGWHYKLVAGVIPAEAA